MEFIASMFHQGASFIIPLVVLLGVLIFVHELGHFSVAKYFGVRVETFSLGFGRKIFQKTVGDTTYCLSIIPFGGYVKMYGDDPSVEIPLDQRKFSFFHQPVLPRICIVLAGPLMNLFLAAFLFILIAAVGEETLKPQLGEIFQGTAAYSAGFRSDDAIKSVGPSKTSLEPVQRWDQVRKSIDDAAGKALTFEIERNGDRLTIEAPVERIANKNLLSGEKHAGDINGLTTYHRAATVGVSHPGSLAATAGLKTGDTVRKVDGREILTWQQFAGSLWTAAHLNHKELPLEIERDGKLSKILLPINHQSPLDGIEPSDLYLSNVLPQSAAADAGIQVGDRLVSINGAKLTRWDDVVKIVQGYQEGKSALEVDFIRNGVLTHAAIVPRMLKQTDPTGIEVKNFALGVVTHLSLAQPATFVFRETSLFGILKRGLADTGRWTEMTAMSFVRMVQGHVSAKSIGGPLMIGKLASETWRIGISPFLKIMAIISINLFLLNLLPVPVLDGGHLLFFSIEFVKGSPLSFRKLEVLQQVGMFLLLALMAFSMFNDIVRLFAT